jgi:hypothetical protein
MHHRLARVLALFGLTRVQSGSEDYMRFYLICAVVCAAFVPSVSHGTPWAGYRFAPNALREIDLASDTAWMLNVDSGPARPIKVTAGGWNSDQQEPPIASNAVKDHVIYERPLEIPAEAQGNVVKVLFGGCNYGAEVFLDDRKVTEHNAPMTPFEADLTGLVVPGKTHHLRVKAYGRYHFGRPPIVTVGFDFNKGITRQFEGCTKYAYGLTGHVRLAIYPPVHVAEVFVRPSVHRDQLGARLWVRNATAQDKRVTVTASLAPWRGRAWRYPALPSMETVIPAHSVKCLTLGPVPWDLGPESYWWPNLPFREDYQATLHWLNLTVSVDGKMCHEHRERFGFVQYAEGPYYYTVNGVRFTSFGDSNSYGQIGGYDCWTETPASNRRRAIGRVAVKRGGATSGSGSTRCGFRPACPPRICWKRPTRPAICSCPRADRGETAPAPFNRRTSRGSCRPPSARAAIIRAWPATRWPTNRCLLHSPALPIRGAGSLTRRVTWTKRGRTYSRSTTDKPAPCRA